MPVKSSSSAILRWPDRNEVLKKAKEWAGTIGRGNRSVVGIYCYGSISDERWGVGSDLDILIEVSASSGPFEKRSLEFSIPDCGVPVDMSVYSTSELEAFRREGRRFVLEFDRGSMVLYRSV
jgi:predicted nucleotidyltransferase